MLVENSPVDRVIDNIVTELLGFTEDRSTRRWEEEARICDRLSGVLSGAFGKAPKEHRKISNNPQVRMHIDPSEYEEETMMGILMTSSIMTQTSPELFMGRVKNHRRQVRVQHNASRPFNRLPTEIGCSIFATALAQERACAPYYKHLHQLRLVCSQWRRALDANPSFWTLLSNRSPPSAWSIILRNSQTAPLRMDFDPSNVKAKLPILSHSEFLRIASSEMHRIKSLSISLSCRLSWNEFQALKSIFETPAPLLEVLNAHLGVIDPGIKIELGAMPRLRDVGVSDGAVRVLNSTSLVNLQALSLAGNSTLPLKRLRDILKTATNLVHLSISGGLDAYAAAVFAPQPTTLLKLKTVYIVGVSPDSISSVLTFFRAPSIDYLALSAGLNWTEYPVHFEQNLSRHIESFIQAQPQGTVLRVRCWHMSVTVNDQLFYLEGAHDGDHPYAMRRVLSHLPPTTLPAHVSVEESVDDNEPNELLAILDSTFPNTLELGLPSGSRLDRRLLGKPQVHDSNQWIFSNMKKLQLNGQAPPTKTLRRAVKIAEARKEAGVAFDSIHAEPWTPYWTRCYRRILREASDVVEIKCDATSKLLAEPERQQFTRLDDPPPDDGRWFKIDEPDVNVPSPQEYNMSTSDEEEPWAQESSEDEPGSDEGGGEDEVYYA